MSNFYRVHILTGAIIVINIIFSCALLFGFFNSDIGLISIVIIYLLCFLLIASLRIHKSSILIFSLFIAFIATYWIFAFPPAINGNDDNTAYLVFAYKTVDYGHLPVEPLSERRAFSLGGSYPFQGSLIDILGINYLTIFEPALGVLLLSFLAMCFGNNYYSRLIPISVISFMPLLGSRVLANTASTFILSFYTLVMIFLVYSLYKKNNYSLLFKTTTFAIIVLSAILAVTLRPTTAPFNTFIVVFLLLIYTLRKDYKTTILSVSVSLIFALLILLPYIISSNLSSGSWSYPLLSRGWHISSDPNFIIYSSVPIIDHISNLTKVPLQDPFVSIIIVIYIISIKYLNNKFFHHFIFLAYIAFYMILIISTGGRSTSRYVFPVSLAVVIFQSVLLLNTMGSTLNPSQEVDANSETIRVAAVIACFFAPAMLMIIWFFYSNSVSATRYKMINISSQQSVADIDMIRDFIENKKERIVVTSSYARSLYEAGFSNIVIHDQPGVMLPWRAKNMREASPINHYANDIKDYLVKNEIRYIVSEDKSCDAATEFLVDSSVVKSWGDIINFGYRLWNNFLCSGLETRYVGSSGICLYEISNHSEKP